MSTNYNLNGNFPLSYRGVNALSPPNLTVANISPTSLFAFNFNEGDLWLNQATQQFYVLLKLIGTGTGRTANWQLLSGGSGAMIQLTGNTGVAIPAAGNINVFANTADGTPRTAGAGSTLTLNFTGANNNLGIGTNSLAALTTGVSNTAYGSTTLASLTTAVRNTAIGRNSLNGLVTGNDNTAIGNNVLSGLNGANNNTALGSSVAVSATTAANNVFIGQSAASLITTGANNIIIGTNAGDAFTTSESSNIIIGSNGVIADANTIRIGTQGAGAAQQNLCFVAGITGVNVGSVATVVSIATGTGQLGTTTITAGTGITVTPGANTITIAATGTTNLTYTNVNTTPYVVLSTDEYLSVDSSGGAITVQLPNAATLGRVWIIKDRTGSAATHNITVTTVGGAVNIDGATTFVMNTNFESINVIGNGSTYEVY